MGWRGEIAVRDGARRLRSKPMLIGLMHGYRSSPTAAGTYAFAGVSWGIKDGAARTRPQDPKRNTAADAVRNWANPSLHRNAHSLLQNRIGQ
jgi:hypothetical protein